MRTLYYHIDSTGYPIILDEPNADYPNAIQYTEGQEPLELQNALVQEAVKDARKHFETLTEQLIHKKVTDYNTANGTAFGNVHSCGNYRHDVGYTHQPFCAQVWAYNVAIWEAVRAWQGTLTAIPKDADWQAVVDGVVF